jgi:hypothetical protein
MKRNPKPFSVEIKRTRVQGQRSDLPPRRLFATILAEATKIFQKEEPQAVAEPSAAPRILPSIAEPVWSGSGPIEPVRRGRFSGEADQGQMEFDLNAIASNGKVDAPAEPPVMLEAVSQTRNSLIEAAATPVLEVQVRETESAKAKSRRPRNKTSKIAEPVSASEPVPQPETASEPPVIEPAPVDRSQQADHRRLTRRQAAAQRPRHERWKRRLHSAAW